jgi:hypothetical protein
MSELTRYDINVSNCGDGTEAEELCHGDWVYFIDADKRIKELEAELDKCRSDHLNAMIPPDGHYAKIMKLEAENAELNNRKKR